MWWLLLIACSADLDHDGLTGASDCDEADPFIYAGAPDTPGDGVDADCDGQDAPLAWLGAWELLGITASYSGLELLVPGTERGGLNLGVDEATAEIVAELEPSVVGVPITVDLQLTGTAAPLPGPDTFALWAEGRNFDEAMHADWDCWLDPADDARLWCTGELKALELSLLADAVYARP
jgi:hypothetical protein